MMIMISSLGAVLVPRRRLWPILLLAGLIIGTTTTQDRTHCDRCFVRQLICELQHPVLRKYAASMNQFRSTQQAALVEHSYRCHASTGNAATKFNPCEPSNKLPLHTKHARLPTWQGIKGAFLPRKMCLITVPVYQHRPGLVEQHCEPDDHLIRNIRRATGSG